MKLEYQLENQEQKPLIRVMTEGENKQLVHKLAEDIAKLIETELN